jgi:HSP20 family molecular chaperone IbpA
MSLLNALLPSFSRTDALPVADTARENDQPPGIRPAYDINESADAYTLTVRLPGVAKTGLTITDEDGVLTLRGERAWKRPEGWSPVYRESNDRPFELSLRHDQTIDVDKISAQLTDGVLTASLPKAESRKPRKIAVA